MAAYERSAFVKLFVIKQHFHEHRLCILLLGDIILCTSNVLNSKEGTLLHCFAFYAFKTGKLTFLKTSNLIYYPIYDTQYLFNPPKTDETLDYQTYKDIIY